MKQPKNNAKNLLTTGPKANADAKVTYAGLVFEYALLYNINLKDRVITLNGEIDESKFALIEAGFTLLESDNRQGITVRINSPGGSVYDALAIIGRMTSSKCHVTTEGYGHIMSAATLILAAGDKRKISKYAFFMHHESSYTVEGKHSAIKNLVNQSDLEDRKWCEWMAEFSKKDKDFWMTNGVGTDLYLTAEQIKEYGVADEII